ncbi:uncharacterized protein [Rutidosis leptorrhynchoides]|uniref:uncharacterized protein n=1 Tax=Rutidosis leptorrhynchoides TaxID=125765 RepID=UPI003A99CFEB
MSINNTHNSTENLTEEDHNSPNHPLFLHKNDHPCLILISKKLTGSDNYGSWKRSMMIALNAKNKLKIVTGELAEPETNSRTRALWERKNDMIISWILNTMTDQIRYWDEIDAIEAPYVCTCVCTCENGKLNIERDQRKRLMQFLMGLDECYSNIRGQILLMQPLPNVNKAYGMIRFNNSNTSRWNPRRTSTANGQQERKSNFKKGILCGNFGLEGHQKEECYKIVGYLVGYPLHSKYTPPNKTSPQYTTPSKSVNLVTTNDGNTEMAMNARMDQLQNQLNQVLIMMQNSQRDGEPGTSAGTHKLIASHISSQKYRFIASLIAHVKDAWVVDSGATDHISTSLSNMHNIHNSHTPILVTLPNGHNTSVATIGSVTINQNIILHDLFYIRSFSYNLLSVSKLGQHIPLSVLFTPLSCYFQDHNKRIVHGTLCNGLYVIHQQLKASSHITNQLTTSTTDETTL